MINEDFYPTPKEVVFKMIEPFKKELNKRYVLEPSAGSGNILDVITGITIGEDRRRNGIISNVLNIVEPI